MLRRWFCIPAILTLAFPAWSAAPVVPTPTAENWPQWRGPKNDGISNEKGLPAEWSETKNIVWKAKMPGFGASTPCIWGEQIFLTAVVETDLVLFCVGKDGKDQWSKKIGVGNQAARKDEGNSASASCSTDGERVYAFVGDGHLVAYTLKGEKAWEVDTQSKYGKYRIQFGAHWTPVLHKGVLYVTIMHQDLQQIVAFDAKTGKENWKALRTSDSPKRTESADVYCSPFMWEKGDKALLIVHGNDYCTAHELKDGKEVWRVTELNPKAKYNPAWRAVASPLVTPDLIVVPSCKNGVTVGIDPSKAMGTIDPGNAAELWRHAKDTPDVPSPLLAEGVLYLFHDKEYIRAFDPKTGKRHYEEKITSYRQRANPMYADGKIYLVGREGDLAVLKAGATFDQVGKNKLPDVFTGSPAVSGGRIYLRGFNYLWAIGTK